MSGLLLPQLEGGHPGYRPRRDVKSLSNILGQRIQEVTEYTQSNVPPEGRLVGTVRQPCRLNRPHPGGQAAGRCSDIYLEAE
jgi:hypothetical protein